MTTASPGVIQALVRSSHPVPSMVVATLTTAFAWGVGLEWWQVFLVFVIMAANQLGVGLGNDWLDAARDKTTGRVDKPIAQGLLGSTVARNVALLLGGLALGLTVFLGWQAVACQAVMLIAGWWYNLHAKRHWSSPLSYLVGFGLLPVFPLLAATPPSLPPWWIIAVAGLLGIAAHFANALPDLISDRETGVLGLPQIFGPKISGVVTVITVTAATALISGAGGGLPLWMRIASGVVAIGASIGAGILAFYPAPPRIIFPLVMVSAAVCTGAIVLTLTMS